MLTLVGRSLRKSPGGVEAALHGAALQETSSHMGPQETPKTLRASTKPWRSSLAHRSKKYPRLTGMLE